MAVTITHRNGTKIVPDHRPLPPPGKQEKDRSPEDGPPAAAPVAKRRPARAEARTVYDPARGMVEHGLRVDEEFRHLGPPLSEDDRDVLEEVAVYRRAFREPLIVWKDHGLILDGHYRFELCLKYGAPFAVVEKELPDRQAARDWILARLYRNRPCSVLGATYLLDTPTPAQKKAISVCSGVGVLGVVVPLPPRALTSRNASV
jgi:hypothetical protein